MWSRKYVVPEICRPETGENMLAQKKNFGGAAPEPPRGGLRPPLTPLRAQRRRSDTTTRAENITHVSTLQKSVEQHRPNKKERLSSIST
jgi:hypothetical protein